MTDKIIITQADRSAIDRAERFARGLHTTAEEHDDIMVAVRLARHRIAAQSTPPVAGEIGELIERLQVESTLTPITVACADDEQSISQLLVEAADALARLEAENAAQLSDIATMMTEFVDNWPPHKKFSTSLALIGKTIRASRDEVARLEARERELVEALESAVHEASLLLQNSEGCAANHYGGDHEAFGMPGWLTDCRDRIAAARAALTPDEGSRT